MQPGHDEAQQMERLAAVYRAARTSRGLRPADLARRSGVSRWTIERLETAERIPSIGNLYKLADALKIPLHRLLRKADALSCSNPATKH